MSDAEAVPAVEVDVKFTKPLVVPFPVQVFPVVAISNNLPVVTESVVRYAPVPDVIAVVSNTKAEVVVVPETTLEV